MFKTKFTNDYQNKTIVIEREFAAPRDQVWQAWTDSKILDKWWAPKPYLAVTKSFAFREGGRWLYYMQSPEGVKTYSLADYLTISPKSSFTAQDAFCDENGKILDLGIPSMHWHNQFIDNETSTKVVTAITFQDAESIEKIIEMGFKEGFTMAHGNLDEIL